MVVIPFAPHQAFDPEAIDVMSSAFARMGLGAHPRFGAHSRLLPLRYELHVARAWMWRSSKGKVILEISWSQIVGDSEAAMTVDPGRDLVDPGAVAVEGGQQSLLAPRGARGKLLQGRCVDKKRGLH
jgi:hypothetical protein